MQFDNGFAREHFIALPNPDEARALFVGSIKTVVLELFSYCNRRCGYCPVSLVDRISGVTFIEPRLLDMVVRDLGAIDYAGSVCLNLYNEPTAQRAALLDACARLHAAAPRAQLLFASNGDYLTAEYLAALSAVGVRHIVVTLHQQRDTAYSDVVAMNRLLDFAARIGAVPKVDNFVPGQNVHALVEVGKVRLDIHGFNLAAAGTNRGGLLGAMTPDTQRLSPCYRPFSELTVSYDGSLFPCCQFFTDAPEHAPYRVGQLGDFPTLFAAYATLEMAGWRRSLLTYGEKAAPCDTCRELEIPGSEAQVAERERLYAALVAPG